MFTENGLAVSLPAREIRNIPLPGSFFTADDVLRHAISTSLRGAIHALLDMYEGTGQKLVFMARPEIFTNGPTLAWLREELGAIGDHVSVSDGSVIHLVPGLRNHVFLYNPGTSGMVKALGILVKWAPELWPQLQCQINGNFSFASGGFNHTPRPVLAQLKKFPFLGEAKLYSFYLNHHSAEDSINRILLAPPLDRTFLNGFHRITYIPFTEAAASDKAFCEAIANLILQTLRARDHALVLGAPAARTGDDNASRMLCTLLEGLNKSGIILPRAVLDNVVLASAFLGDDFFPPAARARLILHDSFAFWRCPKSYYAAFERVNWILPETEHHGAVSPLLPEAIGSNVQPSHADAVLAQPIRQETEHGR